MTHLNGCLSVWCNFVTMNKHIRFSFGTLKTDVLQFIPGTVFPHSGLKDKGTVPDWIDLSLCVCVDE